MRGLQVVLYVVVLLCVTTSAFAQCGSNGHYLDASDNTVCVCESGYSGAACATGPGACGTGVTPSDVQADNFPTLVAATAAYTMNTLRIDVTGPFVAKRVYTNITFVNASDPTCDLALNSLSFWKQSFASCADNFHIDLPWSSHGACGFHKYNSSESQLTFEAKFTISYIDTLGDLFNLTMTRATTVPFRVLILFPTQLTVTLVDVNVTANVEMGVALTMDSFDPDTRQLTLEFTTVLNWPNQLNNDFSWVLTPPSGIALSSGAMTGNVDYLTSDPVNSGCTTDANTVCKQTVAFAVHLVDPTACTYDGYYNLSVSLFTCRQDTDCSSSTIYLGFNISTSTVCAAVYLNNTITGNLKAYDNAAHSGADQSQFNLGTTGYFLVTTDQGVGNTVELKFYDICFTVNTGGAESCLYQNGSAVSNENPGTLGFHQYEAKLNINDAGKSFSVYFSSVVFKVNPYAQIVYTFTARAYVTFNGNENGKRSVEFQWDAEVPTNQMSVTPKKINMMPAASAISPSDNREGNQSDITSNIAYIVGGGGAGLVLIICAVVGLAIHQKKRNAAKLVKAAVENKA